MVTRGNHAYAFTMANGVVAWGMVLGIALWLPVSHIHGHHSPHNALNPTHHSLQNRVQQHHHRHHFGHIPRRRHAGPTGTYSLTPRDLAGLTHNSDAVFEARIVGAHARMYRGSLQPYRLYSFKVLARIKGHVNPHRPIWQSTRSHSAQTRLEVGHTYLLATRNTPGNPYLVLRGPRAVIQVA
jgi:hypothetical protein